MKAEGVNTVEYYITYKICIVECQNVVSYLEWPWIGCSFSYNSPVTVGVSQKHSVRPHNDRKSCTGAFLAAAAWGGGQWGGHIFIWGAKNFGW